ncbi:cytochrome oxidase putative small subunit CydP [Azoarcus olearius]|uniref:Hypothetical membrane protein n=1 Tax=Azoarcus sp. (strain BH72) TaxID=418699 RepID=A1K4U5_AZOSB|nr:cytochrome oxidase putative small subunit CydP [Azoarcus olearius]ANQ84401.1 hypothetical protein dqs_1348 [Azoarcus olearius]CAL93850.1 hypothetical membrane protein [Azoarcus olearius]
MHTTDRRLVRELVLIVLLKLALLAGLWFAFVREARVAVDGAAMGGHVLAAPAGVHPAPHPTPNPNRTIPGEPDGH